MNSKKLLAIHADLCYNCRKNDREITTPDFIIINEHSIIRRREV